MHISGDPLSPIKMHKEYQRRRPEDENKPSSRFYLQINKTTKSDMWYKRQQMEKLFGRISEKHDRERYMINNRN